MTITICIIFALLNRFNGYKAIILITLMIYKIIEAISDCFHGFIQKKEQLYFVGKSLFLKAIFGMLGFFIIDF